MRRKPENPRSPPLPELQLRHATGKDKVCPAALARGQIMSGAPRTILQAPLRTSRCQTRRATRRTRCQRSSSTGCRESRAARQRVAGLVMGLKSRTENNDREPQRGAYTADTQPTSITREGVWAQEWTVAAGAEQPCSTRMANIAHRVRGVAGEDEIAPRKARFEGWGDLRSA